MSPEAILERLQCFLKWNARRIDALDVSHEPVANPACYTRGKGDTLEYWITAETWRSELFADDEDGAAPRAMANLGLLRLPKEPGNFQICADIRRKITKVYAVRAGILTAKANGANGTSKVELPSLLSPTLPANGEPESLSGLLGTGTRLALRRAIELLATSPNPGDRDYAACLRSQTAVINTLISTQARIDETRLREQNRKDAISQALAELRAWPNPPTAQNL
jgi:hypothetical protein